MKNFKVGDKVKVKEYYKFTPKCAGTVVRKHGPWFNVRFPKATGRQGLRTQQWCFCAKEICHAKGKNFHNNNKIFIDNFSLRNAVEENGLTDSLLDEIVIDMFSR